MKLNLSDSWSILMEKSFSRFSRLFLLYILDEISSLVRPVKELKGFKKVDLKPSEKKTIDFSINKRHLSFYDPVKKKWVAEPGIFTILIASSSRDIRLKGSFTLVAK